MKGIKLICLIVIFTACYFSDSAALGRENLNAKQLILLMRASSEQYRTISSKINGTGYQKPTNFKFTQQIISRWTREKEFIKIIEGSNLDTATGKITSSLKTTNTDTFSISGEWSKRLREVAGSPTKKGSISSTYETKASLPCYTLYTAMWGGYSLDLINPDEAEVSYDEKDGLYILFAKITPDNPKGPKIRLYIDPSKGYIPVKQEPMTYQDVRFGITECKDFHQHGDGLWIPYEYSSISDPQATYSVSYKVEDVVVNESIEDSLLDFEFPEGTIVSDERIGSKYKATKAAGQTVTSVPTEPNSKIQLPQPATDEKLRSIAGKASELAAAGAAEKQALKIEVFPQYVYVKPDKTQYSLTIKKYSNTKPQLLDFSFESDKMKLTSVDNKISEKQQLIVHIQRQQEDKGFEKAVLSLQFADEKIDVIFVSPPLENI